MATDLVVVPVVIVPEFQPTDTVFNGELQGAPVVKIGGHDDLKAELVSDTVARFWDIGGQAVHEGYPVV